MSVKCHRPHAAHSHPVATSLLGAARSGEKHNAASVRGHPGRSAALEISSHPGIINGFAVAFILLRPTTFPHRFGGISSVIDLSPRVTLAPYGVPMVCPFPFRDGQPRPPLIAPFQVQNQPPSFPRRCVPLIFARVADLRQLVPRPSHRRSQLDDRIGRAYNSAIPESARTCTSHPLSSTSFHASVRSVRSVRSRAVPG